jgi:hypothetical protein
LQSRVQRAHERLIENCRSRGVRHRGVDAATAAPGVGARHDGLRIAHPLARGS